MQAYSMLDTDSSNNVALGCSVTNDECVNHTYRAGKYLIDAN